MAVQKIDLDAEALMREAGSMTSEQLDQLPFGAIQLDSEGRILAYNATEESISGRKREEVVGRNFFADVAPCTRVKRFHGAFREGIERGELNEVFDFTFRFPTGPKDVRIRMILSSVPRPGVWLFVTPMW